MGSRLSLGRILLGLLQPMILATASNVVLAIESLEEELQCFSHMPWALGQKVSCCCDQIHGKK